MKVELHVKERIYAMNVLPKENSLIDYQLKKRIVGKLGLTDEEKNKLDFKVNNDDGSINWDAKKDFESPASIEFSEDEVAYITKSIQAASDGVHNDEFWLILTTVHDKLNTSNQEK